MRKEHTITDPTDLGELLTKVERLHGRSLLSAAIGYGDELHLDLYRRDVGGREYILATRASHWELRTAQDTPIVSANHPKSTWAAQLKGALSGLRIVATRILFPSLGLEVAFEGLTFRLLPSDSGDDQLARWELTGPGDQELVVGPGSRWSWGPAA